MAVTDHRGLPLALALAEGNRHDSALTDMTLDAAFVKKLPPRLIADKAWDNSSLQKRLLDERHIDLISPKRSGRIANNRKQDKRSLRRYKRRWKVERFFAWIKRWRRLATRWEVKSENFLGFYLLAGSVVLMRAILRTTSKRL
jgi:transposase